MGGWKNYRSNDQAAFVRGYFKPSLKHSSNIAWINYNSSLKISISIKMYLQAVWTTLWTNQID